MLGQLVGIALHARAHSLRLTAGSSEKAFVSGTKSSKGVLGDPMLVWGGVLGLGSLDGRP